MTTFMTLEEAAELILMKKAWEPCIVCQGQGNISQGRAEELRAPVGSRLINCEVCEGAGYLPPRGLQEAYCITGTPYPEKPMSGPDYYAQMMREAQRTISERMQGYIGREVVDPKRLVKEITMTLDAFKAEDFIPESTVTVSTNPTDPRVLDVHIEVGKKI